MGQWVFRNDGLVAQEDAVLHFRDLSFQRGYGVFDFFRLNGNEPLFLNDHLERFYFSAREMRLDLSLSREELKEVIAALIRKNNLPGSGIRFSLTGGYSEDGFNIARPNFLVSQHGFAPPTDEQVQNGIRLLTHPYQRQLPHIKTIDYLMAIWLQPKRVAAGADDILYHQNGAISECPRSNFFLVTAGETIVTPAAGALAGVTRKKVLQLAREHFTVEERPVRLDELATAKEAFITSTTKQILPVAQIDGTRFPGRNVALHLLRLFRSAYSGG